MLSNLRVFPVASLLLLIALAGGGRALACSCGRLSPCEAFSGADAVFVGTVLSSTTGKEKDEACGFRLAGGTGRRGEMYAREVEIAPRGKPQFVKLTLDQPGITDRDYNEFQK